MGLDRRPLSLLVVLAILGAPAVILRLLCVGAECSRPAVAQATIPFCSLPSEIRAQVIDGFYDERSPDLFAVAAEPGVVGGDGVEGDPWPSIAGDPGGRVPIVFWGPGIRTGATVPDGTGLRDIAPTLAQVLRFHRPFPEVRSGRPIPGVARDRPSPRLVLQIVWMGIGSVDLEADPGAWPYLRSLLRSGAGTLGGRVGYLPRDPASAMATLGTGGLPREHGITGQFIRYGDRIVRAWSPAAPLSVIATLPDDFDYAFDQRPLVGLITTTPTARGLIGRNWHVRSDRDDVALIEDAKSAPRAAEKVLGRGYGADEMPDVLGVVISGNLARLDSSLRRIVAAAERASGGSIAVVVTATGAAPAEASLDAADVRTAIERRLGRGLVGAIVVGGLFVDQDALARAKTSQSDVVRVLGRLHLPEGGRAFADVFPGLAVTLARYCR